MELQTQMNYGLVIRFVICLCLVGFAAAKCAPEKCGSMNVSYPFWIHNSDCGYPDFKIKCIMDKSTGMFAPFFRAYLGNYTDDRLPGYDFKIMEINYMGYLIINSTSLRAQSCNESSSASMFFQPPNGGPFTISMYNKFAVVGCKTFGTYAFGKWGDARCVSTCVSQNDPPYCRYGCCEITLPDNWKWFNFTGGGMFGLRNDTTSFVDDECGFSTVLEPSTFKQVDNETNLFWGEGLKAYYGLRLNWGIGLENCSMASATANYSCSSNAECIDSPSGQGHVCRCLPGYQGNGYSNGTDCTDVNECSNPNLNVCVGPLRGGICHNLVGAYNCSCGKGYIGDGFQNGTGCASTNKNNSISPGIIGSVSAFVGVSLGACGLFWWLRRRRWQHFRIWLQKEIASQGGKDLQIFSERELQRASKSYSSKLGEGGFGTVYKGTLSDGKHVAIKKPISVPQVLFNEVIILSLMSHRNIVKMLGCCMKSKSQLLSLVYEFVPNGTLEEHLQSTQNRLPWEKRLQIAIESAEAVAYMHHYASQRIFHRDIKSSNILLDDTLTPKVADFGISRLQPFNKSYLSSDNPSGTLGYVDPQFRETHQFTNKSDVYSFGVVLVELLTGKPAMMFPQVGRDMSFLYKDFLSAFHGDRLNQILDPRVVSDTTLVQMNYMAKLAKACLEMEGRARPSMREVVEELAWIRGGTRQPGTYRDETFVELGGISSQTNFNH